MKIVIEGTPEECAEAIRRMAAPQDIKPVFVPQVSPAPLPWMDPDFFRPHVGDFPPATDRISPFWQIDWRGTQIATDGTQFTYTFDSAGIVTSYGAAVTQ